MTNDILDWLDAEGTVETHQARDEIESLRAQLAECQKERDEFNGANILNKNAVRWQKEKVTAAQARIAELVKTLEVVCKIECVDDLWKAEDILKRVSRTDPMEGLGI